jgi:hypothetical protein
MTSTVNCSEALKRCSAPASTNTAVPSAAGGYETILDRGDAERMHRRRPG